MIPAVDFLLPLHTGTARIREHGGDKSGNTVRRLSSRNVTANDVGKHPTEEPPLLQIGCVSLSTRYSLFQHTPNIMEVLVQHPRDSISPTRQMRNELSPMVFTALVFTLSLLLTAASAAALPEPTLRPKLADLFPSRIDGDLIHQAEGEEQQGLRAREPQVLAKRQETRLVEIASETSVASTSPTTIVETSPLPSPFDSNLAATFVSTGCPSFINSFLTDPQFKECYPFSLLLQSSSGFFDAQKSAVSMTQVLQATCDVDRDVCTTYLRNLAAQLIEEANCQEDFEAQNTVVVQAYNGLIAYEELYSASCLQDNDQGSFCFTRAVMNYTTASNVYLYFLPLNSSLPGRSIPSCDSCAERTMNLFHAASSNRQHPIARTYTDAAERMNMVCGPGFVNETLPEAVVEATAVGRSLPHAKLVVTAAVLLLLQYMAI